MITDWIEFEEYRERSLMYHKGNPITYSNALTFFEYAREYFNINGFPEQTERYKNGNLRPWSDKQKKEQKDELIKYAKKRQREKVGVRKKRRSFR